MVLKNLGSAIFLLFAFCAFCQTSAQMRFLEKVNEVRSNGCTCGKTYMQAVPPLKWNGLLFESALSQAKDMEKNHFFAHYSHNGLNIGERLDKFGYNWLFAGENLGEGQSTFDEVMRDWINSRSHCKMIMNPKVEEIGIANYNDFWVQHFGKPKSVNKRLTAKTALN